MRDRDRDTPSLPQANSPPGGEEGALLLNKIKIVTSLCCVGQLTVLNRHNIQGVEKTIYLGKASLGEDTEEVSRLDMSAVWGSRGPPGID